MTATELLKSSSDALAITGAAEWHSPALRDESEELVATPFF
jgi:hypothetical protein